MRGRNREGDGREGEGRGGKEKREEGRIGEEIREGDMILVLAKFSLAKFLSVPSNSN